MNMHKMVRKAGAVVSIAAVSSMVLAGSVFAQNVPGNLSSGWWSAQTLVNVGAANATVSATAYELSGGSNQEKDVTNLSTLTQGDSITILPGEIANGGPAVEDIATGSMVISSDQPLVAVVALTNEQVTSNLGTAGGTSAGIYEGTGSGSTSTELSFTVAKQNYFGNTTTFFIQNAGAAAADIVANFVWPGGTKSVTYAGIDANRSVAIIPPADMPSAGNGTLGSLTVTSANQLAGAVLELETSGTSSAHKAGRALTTADEATSLLVPSFKKNFGSPKFTSAIGVQGAAALTGEIRYTCSGVNAGEAGCTLGQVYTVPFTTSAAGESYSAWPLNDDHNALPDNSLYSAEIVITAGGNAVADVGETGAAVPGNPPLESAYVAIPSSAAGTNWACPSHKELFFDGAGGVVVLPTSYPANVTVEFTVSDTASNDKSLVGNSYTTASHSITAGAAVFYDTANGVSPGVGWNGTAMPTSPGLLTSAKVTSDQPVVVISNEAIHFSVSRAVDGRQYGCFATTN